MTSGTTTMYIFSGSKVIAEYDNGAAVGSPSREYIYSGGTLLAKIESSATVYYHPDGLSNRIMTDSSGTVVTQQGHYPYGELWYQTGTGTKWFFTTYERDAESTNDYAMARYYRNALGRLNSPDPHNGSIGDPQSLNRYSYSRNEPIDLADPSGMDYDENTDNCTDDQTCTPESGGPDYVGGGLDSPAEDLPGDFDAMMSLLNSVIPFWENAHDACFFQLISCSQMPLLPTPGDPHGNIIGGIGGTGITSPLAAGPPKLKCNSLNLDDPSQFWAGNTFTPAQIDSYFAASNGADNWDGYAMATAFAAQDINPAVGVGIIQNETSFGNRANWLNASEIDNPFNCRGANDFQSSVNCAVGLVTKLENHTYTDGAPMSALVNGQNDLPSDTPNSGQVYSATNQATYKDVANQAYQRLARFLHLCQ